MVEIFTAGGGFFWLLVLICLLIFTFLVFLRLFSLTPAKLKGWALVIGAFRQPKKKKSRIEGKGNDKAIKQ